MAKLTMEIEIECNNAAFTSIDGGLGEEVGRIFRTTVPSAASCAIRTGMAEFIIVDLNGNNVGVAKAKYESEEE